MKKTSSLCCLAACLLCVAWGGVSVAVAAEALPQIQGPGTVYCASDDMRRNYCGVDTRSGVELVRRRSDSPCDFGRTWGYDRRGIWVDRGCRADFQLRGNWGGWDNGYNVYCASDDMRRTHCPTDTRGGVQLIRKRSDSACDFGRTWGYDRGGIWVDRGCRADFQIGGTGGGGWRPGGGGWQPGRGGAGVVTCASDDMRRRECQADTRDGVRLVRQRSDSDCIYGRTWGYGRNVIWVDRGCRADFEVGRIY